MKKRSAKTLSLSLEIQELTEARAKESGVPFSRLVDQALRLLLALPPPEQDEAEEQQRALTRSSETVLQTLKVADGALTVVELVAKTGLSVGVAKKSLFELERTGQVWRWGEDVPRTADGKAIAFLNHLEEVGPIAWGAVEPVDAVKSMINGWLAAGGVPAQRSDPRDLSLDERYREMKSRIEFIGAVQRLALPIDEIDAVRVVVADALGLGVDDLEYEDGPFHLENARERRERQNRAFADGRARDLAAFRAQQEAAARREQENNELQARLDQEFCESLSPTG